MEYVAELRPLPVMVCVCACPSCMVVSLGGEAAIRCQERAQFAQLPGRERLPDSTGRHPEHGSEARAEVAVIREPQVGRQRGQVIGALR